ncbi:MAG: sugar ABC transporter permease [Clostridia bacterium]|nr:sugar ABC transporter permease [Clostridia bacterium]MBQ7305180.1 sugar ABC transporter permease [Clostridia bacterium]
MTTIKKRAAKLDLKQYGMLMALVAIIVLFTILTDGKLVKPMNISNLIFQNAYVIILAIGMLLCILTGGNIDLACGSVVGLIGACAGTFIIEMGMNVYLAIVLCLLIGIGVGMWQGFWIAYVGIPPFICTLSGMLVFRGITLLILKGMTLAPFPAAYQQLSTGFIPDFLPEMVLFGEKIKSPLCLLVGIIIAVGFCVSQVISTINKKKKGYETQPVLLMLVKMVAISAVVIWVFYLLSRYRGIPTVLIILGLLLVVYSFFTQKTVRGRHLYAIGGNMKAARLSGVKTKQMMFFAYTNMSFIAAIAGLVFAARLNSAAPTAGQSFEMDAIASCFIGGASAYGGTGTISGALIGALIMGVLNNGMSLLGLSSNLQQVVKGLVLLAAVAFDVISKNNLIQLPKFFKKNNTANL